MRVVFLTTLLAKFRVPFHEQIRAKLETAGIRYDLIYGQPSDDEAERENYETIDWGKKIENWHCSIGKFSAVWQPALREVMPSDLVIIGQENKHLINYVLQTLPAIWRPKIALWGHGRNFQAVKVQGVAEQWKRLWATRCDWWFAYTELTKKIVEGYGFPRERITVFNNAVDTMEIRLLAKDIGERELVALRDRFEIKGNKIAVYLGSLYNFKRLDFLIDAAQKVRQTIPSFILVIVGGGVDSERIKAAAAANSWIRYLGPRFGREKVSILKLAKVLVMPGLVGLSVLDSAAAGIPIVTTAFPYHSPEIEYLRHGLNSLIVSDWTNSNAYADAIVSLLSDADLQAKLSFGASETAKNYTIDNMSKLVYQGIIDALSSPNNS